MTKPLKIKPPTDKAKAAAPQSSTAAEVVASDLRKVLSYNLRMARASMRMTQRELSKASGISQKHISLIETVGVGIGIDALAALAHALPGITAADLLTPPQPRRFR